MEIEDQVCSPEQAKELAERGVPINTFLKWFRWVDDNLQTDWAVCLSDSSYTLKVKKLPAYTVAELGVLLPIPSEIELEIVTDRHDEGFYLYINKWSHDGCLTILD